MIIYPKATFKLQHKMQLISNNLSMMSYVFFPFMHKVESESQSVSPRRTNNIPARTELFVRKYPTHTHTMKHETSHLGTFALQTMYKRNCSTGHIL